MSKIEIINTSYHKNMTDRHLAQVNFTAWIDGELFSQYIEKTSIDHQSLGRIRFMERTHSDDADRVLVFGRVSHGYGYSIDQDIEGAILHSKGVRK